MIRSIPVCEVAIPRGRREPMKGRVASVARSISEIGLLHPIVLNEDYRLIAGRTRLEAVKLLGWKTIDATILDADELHAELAEIDENLERSTFTTLEESQLLARRKALYLAIHPETAAGQAQAAGANKARGRNVVAAESAATTFAKETAKNTGKAERTIRENVQIGENLAPEAAEALKGTPVENAKGQLQQLARLPEAQQIRAAKKIKAGKAKTVREATGKRDASPADTAKHQIKIWADTVGRWLQQSPSIDDYRNQWPSEQGDTVVKHATDLFETLKNWQRGIK